MLAELTNPRAERADLPRYMTVAETARCLGLPEARVRDWQLQKLIAPALTKGRLQFARHDVVRMFVLLQLQDVFGQVALATALAQAVSPAVLKRVVAHESAGCAAHEVCVEAELAGRMYHVALDPDAVQGLRERML